MEAVIEVLEIHSLICKVVRTAVLLLQTSHFEEFYLAGSCNSHQRCNIFLSSVRGLGPALHLPNLAAGTAVWLLCLRAGLVAPQIRARLKG